MVLERGVLFVRENNWRSPCAEQSVGKFNIEQFTKTHQLRPILVEYDHPDPDAFITFLLSSGKGPTLDSRIQELTQRTFNSRLPLAEGLSLTYAASSLVYHCKNIAERYASVVRSFSSHMMPGKDSDLIMYQDQVEPLFELDAVIGAAIRTLQQLRYPLWHLYGGSGSLPRSFRHTLDKCVRLSGTVRERIEKLFDKYCADAKEYRDCLEHYLSPVAPRQFAAMKRLSPGVWSMTAWLPDNPQARSWNSFKYTRKRDALTYGWELTNAVIGIVFLVIGNNQSH